MNVARYRGIPLTKPHRIVGPKTAGLRGEPPASSIMEHQEENQTATTADNPFVSAFDDEFAVNTPRPSEYEFSMVDGIRDRAETRPTSSVAVSYPPRSISLNSQADSQQPLPQPSRPPPVRSSIAKNPPPSDSFRGPLPNRLARAAADSQPGQPIDSLRRSSSRASSYAPYERSTTPGLNGPSHPYGMYPQTGIPRSSSVTTSSTRHSSSTAASVTRPAHPYALYQQNGLPVSDDDSTIPPLPVAQIGFPGRNANFHRQLGPDGEEQDIIGPDGHTEQLPPYSKYPNENEKTFAPLAAAVPASPTSSRESQQILLSPAQLPSQTSQQHVERLPSETAGSGSTAAASEKSWREKNWMERMKTKVLWGLLPYWLLIVAFGCLVFVSIVIGSAIGGFLAKQKEEQYDIHRHHTLTSANAFMQGFHGCQHKGSVDAGCITDTNTHRSPSIPHRAIPASYRITGRDGPELPHRLKSDPSLVLQCSTSTSAYQHRDCVWRVSDR